MKFPTDGNIVGHEGLPCVMMLLLPGESIGSFCRKIRFFEGNNFYFYRQRICLLNRLEPMAANKGQDSLGANVEFIYVPLNFDVWPKLLPEYLEAEASLAQFILIDVGKQCLGLYEYGKMVALFPISSGKHGTPAQKFVVLSKEHDHYSTKYDNAWMPYSMRLFGDYFLHGGILPSYAASHGCVRMIYEEIIIVYDWAKVGTPGEIIKSVH
jgi:lipoprotein-anchoring transpeptidase ErfK/SrfK